MHDTGKARDHNTNQFRNFPYIEGDCFCSTALAFVTNLVAFSGVKVTVMLTEFKIKPRNVRNWVGWKTDFL